MNIAEEIFQNADPKATAVIEKGIACTYEALDLRSKLVASWLGEHEEVFPTARIGLTGADSLSYLVLSLGILRAGGCFVPIAPELSRSEAEELSRTLHLDGILDSTAGIENPSFVSLSHPACPWQQDYACLNPALIRFSSGTTGDAKGILLSHETLLDRIITANAGLGIGPDDRILWVLSMSHHYAVSILLYLYHGATIILPESHRADALLAEAVGHRASVLYGAPFHYVMLCAGEHHLKWPTLRLAVSTTAGITLSTAESFTSIYGVHPSQALGVMEVGLPFINNDVASEKPDSIGRPQAGVDARILDEEGAPVQSGMNGRLELRCRGMFDAYLSPWRPRDRVTREGGWFETGDIVHTDEEGYYYLRGRTKTVISVGGMKFFPEEVEDVLMAHPGVSEARVMAREHSIFGSSMEAEVLLSGEAPVTDAELLKFCKSKLARYKIPARIVFVEKIPRTASGKIQRYQSQDHVSDSPISRFAV
jgi:long-chain acyl-CoA synthetase